MIEIIKKGDAVGLEALLTKNPLYVKSHFGSYISTPLHLSSYHNQLECARICFKHGAQVDSRDESGDSPFILAEKNNNYAMMQLLLDAGANINWKNDYGKSAMWYAIWQHTDAEKVKFMIDRGAETSDDDKHNHFVGPILYQREQLRKPILLTLALWKYSRQDKNVVRMIAKQMWSRR